MHTFVTILMLRFWGLTHRFQGGAPAGLKWRHTLGNGDSAGGDWRGRMENTALRQAGWEPSPATCSPCSLGRWPTLSVSVSQMSNWNINTQRLEQAMRKGLAKQPEAGTERKPWVMRQGPGDYYQGTTVRRASQSSDQGVKEQRGREGDWQDPGGNCIGKECLFTVYSIGCFDVLKIKKESGGRGVRVHKWIYLGASVVVSKRHGSVTSQAWSDCVGVSW